MGEPQSLEPWCQNLVFWVLSKGAHENSHWHPVASEPQRKDPTAALAVGWWRLRKEASQLRMLFLGHSHILSKLTRQGSKASHASGPSSADSTVPLPRELWGPKGYGFLPKHLD